MVINQLLLIITGRMGFIPKLLNCSKLAVVPPVDFTGELKKIEEPGFLRDEATDNWQAKNEYTNLSRLD